jgi:hypothetical protein
MKFATSGDTLFCLVNADLMYVHVKVLSGCLQKKMFLHPKLCVRELIWNKLGILIPRDQKEDVLGPKLRKRCHEFDSR